MTPSPGAPRTEGRALLQALQTYRVAVRKGTVTRAQRRRAREAFQRLGGDPLRSNGSLKEYDSQRYGPFLGVSDEGSAARAIRTAAFASPKVRALPSRTRPTPLVVGVSVDAERLGGIGEVAVGPDEYADVWIEAVERLLITTNIGTRVNMRTYRREPVVEVKGSSRAAMKKAREEISLAFRPFVLTPNGIPRPLTVFVDIPNYVKLGDAKKRALLRRLVRFVSTGGAAGEEWRRTSAPKGHALGLATWVGLGEKGRDQSLAAIRLAASAGIGTVMLEGVKRKVADRAISLAGLLDYFKPSLVGPIVREASRLGVALRAANLPDTDTIARSTWVGLTTARSRGANLGKYGCFPLTLAESSRVIAEVQHWMGDWSPAPVFFVDQGLLRETGVDVGHDLMRGLKIWLRMVASHGVRVVLIDTVDKATGRRLLRKDRDDPRGYLTLREVAIIERLAAALGVRVLWAGGLGLRESYAMGRLGVFGIYVTTAAATTIPVSGSYVRDPALAGLKEPTREAVLRTKVVLEAGWLSSRLDGALATSIADLAGQLLDAQQGGDAQGVARMTARLALLCREGWQSYWRILNRSARRH